ncbi:MAG TPA: hypothetical protein VG013_40035, partial [Gemmataceae bacterium]|nr:hypothetical protein [Gemmataceae bacterium]
MLGKTAGKSEKNGDWLRPSHSELKIVRSLAGACPRFLTTSNHSPLTTHQLPLAIQPTNFGCMSA